MFTSTYQSRNQPSFQFPCLFISSALQFAVYSSSQAPSSPAFGESSCPALHLSLGFISRHPDTQWSLGANRSKGCSGLTLPLKSGLLMILFPFCFENLLIFSSFFSFLTSLHFQGILYFALFLKACVGESSGFLTHTLVFAGFHALPNM